MIQAWTNRLASLFADQQQSRWMGAFVTSTLFHLGLIAFLSVIWVAADPLLSGAALSTKWTPNDGKELESLQLEEIETVVIPQNTSTGGARAGQPDLPTKNPTTNVVAPNVDHSLASAWFGNQYTSEQLAQEVGAAPSFGNENEGKGTGEGKGDGIGNNFFGLAAQGQTFVFVLDCSNSMNHKYDGPAGTRFKQLKLEILKSVSSMKTSQRFFIIFFNNQAIPMPANSLQRALPEMQERFLYWVHKVRAQGHTDPRSALGIALKLQPDVIYFLTDGDFERPIKKDLRKLRQRRSAIHTFAFGNRTSEFVLQELASKNGGEYHYIP